MVHEYHDARDARDSLRESEFCMQMEDSDFAEAVPVVTFKQWLIDRKRQG
jgi:hypothetical protein